jgi:hypothetical protein
MKMRVALMAAGLAAGTLLSVAVAQAATYDLSGGLYTANTSGSPWAITFNSAPLTLKSGAVNNNHLFPVIPPQGIFSAGATDPTDLNDGANTPFVFRAAQDGHFATGLGGTLTDGDFKKDDVVVHSPNAGSAVTITWTAPAAGNISGLDLGLWFAHSTQPARSNDVTFSVGTLVASLNTSTGETRPTTLDNIFNDGATAVAAGELLTLTFTRFNLEFGSLSGVALSFNFDATAVTPVPASLPLFVSALAGLGWFAHRRRRGQPV